MRSWAGSVGVLTLWLMGSMEVSQSRAGTPADPAVDSIATARPVPPTPRPPARASRLRVKKMILGIRHRAHADFYDEVTVKLGETFTVGDTKYTGKVLRFVPDFGIDLATRQVFSKSDEPANPAVHVATAEGGAPHDTSWAFLNFPPHFSKRALLAFQLLRVEFENHAPATIKDLRAPDSTHAEGKKQ